MRISITRYGKPPEILSNASTLNIMVVGVVAAYPDTRPNLLVVVSKGGQESKGPQMATITIEDSGV